MKDYFSPDFTSLLQGLLCFNPKKRLSIEAIKKHPFFKKVNWETIKLKDPKVKPPFKPKKQKLFTTK